MTFNLDSLESIYRKLMLFDTALSVEISDRLIRLVKIRRLWSGYQFLAAHTIEYAAISELGSTLRQAIERHSLKADHFIAGVALEGALLKQISIPADALTDIDAAIRQRVEEMLPALLDAQAVRISWRLAGWQDQQATFAVAVHRREVCEELVEHLAEWEPAYICFAPFGWACQPGFLPEKGRCLVVDRFAGGICLNIFEDAQLQYFLPVYPIDQSPEAMQAAFRESQELKEQLSVPGSPVLIAMEGPEAAHLEAVLAQFRTKQHQPNIAGLEPQYYRAAIIGAEFFHHQNSFIEIRRPAARLQGEQILYKHLAKKAVLVFGLLILLLSGFAHSLQAIANWQYQRYQAAYAEIAPDIGRRNILRAHLDSLNVIRDQYTFLTGQSSYAGVYLYQLSGLLPKNLWFESIRMVPVSTTNGPAGEQFLLHGLARDEASVSRFMQQLQAATFAKDLVLDEMIVHNGGKIFRKWRIRAKRLIEFRMHFNVRI